MTIVIQPISEADGEEWARLYYTAFKNVLGYLFLSEPSDESYKQMGVGNISTLKEPGTHIFKAVDTATNKIIGLTQWQIFMEPPSPEILKTMCTELSEGPEVDSVRRSALLVDIMKSRREIMSMEPCLLLRLMMVHPDYQRKGIGTSLMQWGIEQMDQLGIRGYVEASKHGRKLYEEVGYKTVREIVFEWEGSILDINCTMIRTPGTQSHKN